MGDISRSPNGVLAFVHMSQKGALQNIDLGCLPENESKYVRVFQELVRLNCEVPIIQH